MGRFKRFERVNSLIADEVSRLLEKEGDFGKAVLVTLTRVKTSANLIQAKVFISVFPSAKEQQALENINRKIYDIQQKFNRRVNMRPVPRLVFALDKAVGEAARIEELLEKIRQEKKSAVKTVKVIANKGAKPIAKKKK